MNTLKRSLNTRPSIGYVLSNEQWLITDLVDQAVAAEVAGFDMVWTSDHFHPWQDNQGHAGHAWILMAALSQRIGIPFGTGVTCPTYRHHPSIVAQAFASLAHLHPGGVFLGVGTGEALNEQASGAGWGDYDERAARLEEAVQLIRQLWTGDWVTFSGEYYDVPKARLYDAPPQPVPLYVAGSGPNSFHVAGMYGDGWITEPKNALDPEARAQFEAGARDAGKDPSQLDIICELFVFVGREDDPELQTRANQWRFLPKAWTEFVDNPDPLAIEREAQQKVKVEEVTQNWIVGDDPQTFISEMQRLFDGGVTRVFIHSAQQDQARVINFFGQQVIPHVRRAVPVR